MSFHNAPLRRRARSATSEVLAHGHAREQLDALEGAPDAEARPPVRRQAADRHAAEPHRARVRPQRPAQAVEQRRLARAVRPDQADELALAHRQAHVGERGDAGELHRDVLGDEERIAGRHASVPRGGLGTRQRRR